MTCDFLNGLGVHPKHDTICDKGLPGGMVGDQFILRLAMLPGLAPGIIDIVDKVSDPCFLAALFNMIVDLLGREFWKRFVL